MIKQRNSPNNLLLLVAVRSRADVYFLEIICSEKKKKELAFCTTTEVKEMQLILSFLINYVLSIS